MKMMKTKLIAMVLICALMLCGVCMAEEARPRLDAADRIVYQITNGKYRILDMEGKFIGEDYEAFPSDQIDGCAVYMANGRFGYVAKDGTIIIEPNYLYMPEFVNGYAVVCLEDIDATERTDFSGVTSFPNIYGAIDAYGDIALPIEYEYARLTRDGQYAVISADSDSDYMKDGLYDLQQGKIVLEPQYYSIDDPHDGTAVVCECTVDHNSKNTSGDEYTYKYGIVNMQGDVLAAFDYDRIEYNEGFNAYTCYIDEEISVIYEIQDGALVERAE